MGPLMLELGRLIGFLLCYSKPPNHTNTIIEHTHFSWGAGLFNVITLKQKSQQAQ